MRNIRKHLMLGYSGELGLRIFNFDMYVFVCLVPHKCVCPILSMG